MTALVSESKNYNLYDLAGETEVNVKAWQGDSLRRDIDVGKTASSFRHTFVSPDGNNRVENYRGNFRNTFDIHGGRFQGYGQLTYTPSDIQQIQITNEKHTFMLNRIQLPEKEETPTANKKRKRIACQPKRPSGKLRMAAPSMKLRWINFSTSFPT